jgi:hypothetical protein
MSALVAVSLIGLATSGFSAIVADIKGDYVAGTSAGATTATTNPGGWDYYQTDTLGPSTTGSLTLLAWDGTQSPGSGAPGRYERAGASHSGGGNDFPMVSDHGGYDGYSGYSNELFVHPGDTTFSGSQFYVLLRWVAGALDAGDATISGYVRRPNSTQSGSRMKIYVDSVEVFDSGTLFGATASFNINRTFTAGSTVDFVFDPVGTLYSDTNYIAATISVVPEPASIALLGLGGLMVIGRRKRRA